MRQPLWLRLVVSDLTVGAQATAWAPAPCSVEDRLPPKPQPVRRCRWIGLQPPHRAAEGV